MDETELADLDVAAGLMAGAIREAVYRSSRLSLTPEQVIAALLLAYGGIKGTIPGLDVLERGRALAVEAAGQVADLVSAETHDPGHMYP